MLMFFNFSSYAHNEKHLDLKFTVLDVSPVQLKGISKDLCQIDLQSVAKPGSSPVNYKASGSSVICTFKKGQVVELGIHSPICHIIWDDNHPPGSADQVACMTDRKWFVMTYTHMQEGQQITSHWNYDYKKHTYKIDDTDPKGAPARYKARALKSLLVKDCYPIQQNLLTSDQSQDCLIAVEKIVTDTAIRMKNPKICKQAELNEGVAPFDQVYARCIIEVIAALKKPELCEMYLYHDVEEWFMNTTFKDCIWKLNDVRYCDSVPKTKVRVKNLCYSATGTCEKVTGDFEKTQCPYYRDKSRK